MHIITRGILLTSLMMAVSANIAAEQIRIPIGQQGAAQAVDKPVLGMSMESVLGNYGEPVKRFEAVGEPPISRWQYPGFTVYFEHQTVMHSVISHSPEATTETMGQGMGGDMGQDAATDAELQEMQ